MSHRLEVTVKVAREFSPAEFELFTQAKNTAASPAGSNAWNILNKDVNAFFIDTCQGRKAPSTLPPGVKATEISFDVTEVAGVSPTAAPETSGQPV